MALSKKSRFLIILYAAIGVIIVAIAAYEIYTGYLKSSAQVTEATITGKVQATSPCNARNAKIKVQNEYGNTPQGIKAWTNYWATYTVEGVSATGATYYLMAHNGCGGTYKVPLMSGNSQTWQKGRCESDWQSVFVPYYQYKVNGPSLREDIYKFAYFAVKVTQNVCPPRGGRDCVNPVQGAAIWNPYLNKYVYTNSSGIARIDLIPGSWNVKASYGGKSASKVISTNGCDGQIVGIQLPRAQ